MKKTIIIIFLSLHAIGYSMPYYKMSECQSLYGKVDNLRIIDDSIRVTFIASGISPYRAIAMFKDNICTSVLFFKISQNDAKGKDFTMKEVLQIRDLYPATKWKDENGIMVSTEGVKGVELFKVDKSIFCIRIKEDK